jgi:hypothetical protein
MRAGLESYLFEPEGVTVVEWAERWLGQPSANSPFPTAGFLRRVWIETLSDSERQITYEDSGA